MDRSHTQVDRLLKMQQTGATGFSIALLVVGVVMLVWGETAHLFTCLIVSMAFGTVSAVTACTRATLTILEARITKLEQRLAEHSGVA
jgi:hypothetical protein